MKKYKMTERIDKIFYINLEKRQDRRAEIENELQTNDLYDNAERIEAIHTPHQGILGCTKSHLKAIETAKERNYKNVLILEDDFYFIISKEEFKEEIEKFFNTVDADYDVCMISYLIQRQEPTEYPHITKVLEAQTASGYIVNNRFYDKLIELYTRTIPLLESTKEHWNYANDQSWKELQPTAKWYCLTKRCGKQRDGFSDNSNCYQSYNC